MMRFHRYCFTLIALVAAAAPARAEDYESLYRALEYRSIGPYRGGRSAAVTGVAGKPMLYYFGSTGGGVWKTIDGGSTWTNISDGYFGGSIGAVAVAPSDRNVVYVGGGEKTVRGNVSHGYGIWKSLDAGQTWKSVGLDDSRHVPRIRVHPDDPDTVYVAALGHLYGPNQQRGIFRSTDGGASWERILFVNDESGAVDLVLDPNNARVMYASFWRIRRTPYSLESGGDGSGIWKSTDGGDTWTEITRRPGLPAGTVGISGVAVSPVDSNRLWVILEAADGGVFRSENGGESFSRVNEDRNLRQRAWYYTRIYAGPKNIDEVYVLNVAFWRSGDGGSTFTPIGTPHSDHHDLWIDPEDPARMVIGDDGGAQVTFNRGDNWSDMDNQPTAQFYRVTTDNHFPYRIYGAQQDNSTVRILHRSDSGTIGERDWESSAGGESGFLAPDPTDPDVVYGGSYGGFLTRINHRTGERRAVDVWPDNPMGHGAEDAKYRFQWNFPIFFSPHDPTTLYSAANVLFKTGNGGQNWTQISPDLTRNDRSKLGPSGGPITKDNTSVEYYCTIFAALESPHEPGVLWTGSDDGLVHVSRDGGKNWTNVTPPGLPEWSQINSIEAHPTEKGGLYLAATRYKLDDFNPYLYRTIDYGQSWTRIDQGIDRKHFTRVVRADPGKPGLLYAGTESGMYVSFDDGGQWKPFQLNLPVVPITDLAIKDNDLVVATQGRSFWVLDDLTPLHQFSGAVARADWHVFQPRPVYRLGGGRFRRSSTAGQNPVSGVVVSYHLRDKPADERPLELEIQQSDGTVIARFSSKPGKGVERLAAEPGMNQLVWDMRYPDARTFPGLILWAGGTQGPSAVPGTYLARFALGDATREVPLEIKIDPRSSSTVEDLQAQFDFLIQVRDKLSETHDAIQKIRDVRGQLNELARRLGDDEESSEDVVEQARKIAADLTAVEEALYQTKNQSSQDPLNFPIRLNNKLSALARVVGVGDYRPTDQSEAVRLELTAEIDEQLDRYRKIIDDDLPAFNKLVQGRNVPAIFVD